MIKAQYTIVLKTLLDDPESKALIDEALSTYPLYTAKNEAYYTKILSREELNNLILDHFIDREIGFESFGMFLHKLKHTMNLIMPYHNQKFASEDIINAIDDIFGNIDITETFNQSSTDTSKLEGSESGTSLSSGTNTSESSGSASDSTTTSSSMSSSGKKVGSDTPMNDLGTTPEDMESVGYANNVEWNKDKSSNEGTSSGTSSNTSEASSTAQSSSEANNTKSEDISKTGSVEHTLHRKGNQGVNTYAHDMLEFRTLFINIAYDIIKDLEKHHLFMEVF